MHTEIISEYDEEDGFSLVEVSKEDAREKYNTSSDDISTVEQSFDAAIAGGADKARVLLIDGGLL